MTYYLGRKTRSYRVDVSIAVDNADDPKNEKQMSTLCEKIFKDLEETVNALDGGSNRLTITVRRNDSL